MVTRVSQKESLNCKEIIKADKNKENSENGKRVENFELRKQARLMHALD